MRGVVAGAYGRSTRIDEFALPSLSELSAAARRSLAQPNAGGQSEISEALSVELFARLEAADFVLEMEVPYWCEFKMVDYLMVYEGERVGVSVTRALGFPREDAFDETAALVLLGKKLYGLVVARNAVDESHGFDRSVLHVWCQSRRIADLLARTFASFDNCDFGIDVGGVLALHLTVCPAAEIYANKPLPA